MNFFSGVIVFLLAALLSYSLYVLFNLRLYYLATKNIKPSNNFTNVLSNQSNVETGVSEENGITYKDYSC